MLIRFVNKMQQTELKAARRKKKKKKRAADVVPRFSNSVTFCHKTCCMTNTSKLDMLRLMLCVCPLQASR